MRRTRVIRDSSNPYVSQHKRVFQPSAGRRKRPRRELLARLVSLCYCFNYIPPPPCPFGTKPLEQPADSLSADSLSLALSPAVFASPTLLLRAPKHRQRISLTTSSTTDVLQLEEALRMW